MRLQFPYILLIIIVCVCSASLALGASVTVTSSGAGVFTVLGDNMKGIHGIDLTIEYEKSLLSSPSVKWGALTLDADMHIANTTTKPGSIIIGIVKAEPFTQNGGPIATVTFATQNSSCGITSVSAKVLDNTSAHVPVPASLEAGVACAATADPLLISTPGIPFSQPASTGTSTTPSTSVTTPASSTPVPLGLGTVTMPGDALPRKDEKAAEPKVVAPAEPAEAAEAATYQVKQSPPEKNVEEAGVASIKQTVYGGVLDRFRIYQGEKKPEIMIALFTKEISPSIQQLPPVIISDGKTVLQVSVDQTAINGTSTNFAFNGAKLVSMKREDDSARWILEILPHVNALTASLTILNSSSMIDFPLTVVPPTSAVTGKKADFETFLKDSGASAPKYDLNGDGRHDYLDDYIYTAHYLIRSGAAK